MRSLLTATCVGSVLLLATASWAATEAGKSTTLEPVKGEVWINHGKGFVKVDQPMEAKVGDSIMVSPGGDAKVTYPDKCEAKVKPGRVMTIAPLSPCASGSYAADLSPMVTKAPPAAAPAEFTPWWFFVPLAGVGAFIGCEIANGCFQSGSP
jgi:hypothetical protein